MPYDRNDPAEIQAMRDRIARANAAQDRREAEQRERSEAAPKPTPETPAEGAS